MSTNALTFIAEIGLNHNGNFGLLFELIKRAALSGADIAKFQLGWRAAEGEMNNLGEEEIKLIQQSCAYHDIEPMFSIFTPDAWQLAQKYDFNAFKIASRTVKDAPKLVEEIIATGKRTFISLGMWDGDDKPFGTPDNVEYFWCKSEYPAYPWKLTGMPKDFAAEGFAGYSDHSVGIEVPLMAIMRGATVIEKHFTLDKSDTTIRDHALSATPDEFEQMITLGRAMKKNIDMGL